MEALIARRRRRRAKRQASFTAETNGNGHRASAADQPAWPRYLVERLLLDTSGYLEKSGLPGSTATMHAELAAARRRLADAGMPVPAVEAMARYEWIGRILDGGVTRPRERAATVTRSGSTGF